MILKKINFLVFSLTLLLVMSFSNISLAASGNYEEKSNGLQSENIQILLEMIEKGKSEVSPPVKMTSKATDVVSGKEVELPVKIAARKVAPTKDTYEMLAAVTLDSQSSKSYGPISQYHYARWEDDGTYIKWSTITSWWTRTSYSYTVKDARIYANQQGIRKGGGTINWANYWDIPTPSWHYTLNSLGYDYTSNYYLGLSGTDWLRKSDGHWGTWVRGDIYYSGSKVYDNMYTYVYTD